MCNSGNNARDLRNHIRRTRHVAVEPYLVTLYRRPPADSDLKPAPCQVPVVMPHEYIHWLYTEDNNKFRLRFLGETDDALDKYWKHMLETQLWLREHEGLDAVIGSSSFVVPLRLHGDDVVYNNMGASTCVLNICVEVCHGFPVERWKELLTVVRCNYYVSIEPVIAALIWSFNILLRGTMPTTDHEGAPLCGRRAHNAGKRVAGPYTTLLCSITGDWQFYKDCFHMAHNYIPMNLAGYATPQHLRVCFVGGTIPGIQDGKRLHGHINNSCAASRESSMRWFTCRASI